MAAHCPTMLISYSEWKMLEHFSLLILHFALRHFFQPVKLAAFAGRGRGIAIVLTFFDRADMI